MRTIPHDFGDGLSCLERIVQRIERKKHVASALWFLAGMAFMAFITFYVEVGAS